MPSRGLFIGIVIALIALCLCACAVLAAGLGGFWLYRQTARLSATATPRPTRDPNATIAPAPTPSAAALAEMDSIQAWVLQQRGLPPAGEFSRQFLNRDQMLERTLKDFEEETSPEEVDDDERLFSVLGLTPPGIDLYNLYIRMQAEGVVGFYDPDTKELVVISEEGLLNVYEKVTYAHEYNHALQDQNYRIRDMGFSEEGWSADSEKAAAVQALLEGDSSLLEEQYKDTLSRDELREYDDIVNAFDVSIYFELPEFLLQDLIFPYQQGRDFVNHFYTDGGWARVDEVWRDPPLSTEHILHPERYEAGDNPIAVPRPALTDTLGLGWRQLDSNVMGEWYTYLILAYGEDRSARLSEARAARAAEGWGGDSYTVFYNDSAGQTLLALHTQWDTPGDADEFVSAFQDYADGRFGRASLSESTRACWEADGLHCLYTNGVHTLWLAAPDPATLESVLAEYPDLK